jgi:hypothetical protein
MATTEEMTERAAAMEGILKAVWKLRLEDRLTVLKAAIDIAHLIPPPQAPFEFPNV